MTAPTLERRVDEVASAGQQMAARLDRSLAEEEQAGARLARRGRTGALLAIAVLLFFLTPFPAVLYYHGLIVLFILLGYAAPLLHRAGVYRDWHAYVLVALDFALLAFTLIIPNPYAATPYPPQLTLLFGNFIYFFVLLVSLGFSYRPPLVIWGGFAGGLAWAIGVAWMMARPETRTQIPEGASMAEALTVMMQPGFVDLGVRLQEVVVFAIVAGLLCTIVLRSRRLLRRQVTLERERANLARYFPPATVDLLADKDAPLGQVREQNVAVLFADIVGFTAWAERHTPTEVINLLRAAHGRLEAAVFAHDGALDKFMGDGMMATFGTPEPGARDANNALACARAILKSFDDWNDARPLAGEAPVRISLGLHYGPVVVGDIGSERRLEYAVLGDTVNVASRLEALTRDLGRRVVVSRHLIEAIGREQIGDLDDALAGFREHGAVPLKGRSEKITVWSDG